jgi:hypothetical protein
LACIDVSCIPDGFGVVDVKQAKQRTAELHSS